MGNEPSRDQLLSTKPKSLQKRRIPPSFQHSVLSSLKLDLEPANEHGFTFEEVLAMFQRKYAGQTKFTCLSKLNFPAIIVALALAERNPDFRSVELDLGELNDHFMAIFTQTLPRANASSLKELTLKWKYEKFTQAGLKVLLNKLKNRIPFTLLSNFNFTEARKHINREMNILAEIKRILSLDYLL